MHSNPKVKAKLFNDIKLTSKKRHRSTSREGKSKTIQKNNLFPGVILPFKKKSTAKKLFIKTESPEEKNNVLEQIIEVKKKGFDFFKPSSSNKDVWSNHIKQEKPERIKIEQPDNRKFFKSKVIQNDTPNR